MASNKFKNTTNIAAQFSLLLQQLQWHASDLG